MLVVRGQSARSPRRAWSAVWSNQQTWQMKTLKDADANLEVVVIQCCRNRCVFKPWQNAAVDQGFH